MESILRAGDPSIAHQSDVGAGVPWLFCRAEREFARGRITVTDFRKISSRCFCSILSIVCGELPPRRTPPLGQTSAALLLI